MVTFDWGFNGALFVEQPQPNLVCQTQPFYFCINVKLNLLTTRYYHQQGNSSSSYRGLWPLFRALFCTVLC